MYSTGCTYLQVPIVHAGCVPACTVGAKEVQYVCLPAGAKGVCLFVGAKELQYV
jgi:hypothetical protein